jgi:hypothetical protein
MKHGDPDDQVRNERDNRQNICPGNIADYEYCGVDVRHQNRLKRPWIQLSLDSLDDGHYQIADGDSCHKERNIVAVIHFLDWFLDISSRNTPGKNADKYIDDLGYHRRLIGSPAKEITLCESSYLFYNNRKFHQLFL